MQFSVHQLLLCILFSGILYGHKSMGQDVLDRSVSIEVQDLEIKKILHLLEKKADVRFVYNSDAIDATYKTSIQAKQKKLESILQELFQNSNIYFSSVDNFILLKKSKHEIGRSPKIKPRNRITYAEPERIISGSVRDEKGNPLIGVSILIKGSSAGTATDELGNFQLAIPDQGSVVLVFTYIGFIALEEEVGTRSNVNVQLKEDSKSLKEVVVIGYGERQRRDLTGAVGVVSSEDITKAKAINPELSMQGRLAGVFVGSAGGAPNARPTVRIRGVNTLGNNEPLYVIDGVPVTEFANGATQANSAQAGDIRGTINVLSLINPNDIESISVLKDASAAAIYGVRAANGVVIITTKKGKLGKPRVEVSASRGIQNLPNTFDVLNVSEYVELVREAYANNPAQANNLPNFYKEGNAAYLGNQTFTDWQEAILNKNAVTEDYSAKVSGGSEGTNYYFSAGFANTESPIVENNLKRYSLATNINSRIGKRLEVGLTSRTSFVEALDNSQTDLSSAWRYVPWQPIFKQDGSLANVVNPTFTPNPNFNPTLVSPGSPFNVSNNALLYGTGTRSNVFGLHDVRQTDYNLLRVLGSAFVQLEVLKGLKLKGTLSTDWYLNTRNVWQAVEAYRYISPFSNTYAGTNGTSKGSYNQRTSRNHNLVKEFSINYACDFAGHRIDVLLNAMDQVYGNTFTQANNTQITADNPDARTLLNTPPFSTALVIKENNALQGYMARLSYNYKSKYYLDATLRRDGTSRFAEDYRWGMFPSLALAWRISAEPFLQGQDWLSDLKIRAGWGELGNQETRLFAYLSQVNFNPDYAYGSGVNGDAFGALANGIRLPDFPVENLSWERVQTKNIGFDAAFFDNRLTATVEYYDKLTSGILQAVTLPPSVGLDAGFSPVNNIASVRNRGIEVQLSLNGKIGTALNYNVSGNFTTVRNEVQELYRDLPFGSDTRTEIGQPIGYFFGYKVAGVYQNQAEIDARVAKDGINGDKVVPGDLYFQDINGDGVINAAGDRTYLGSNIPGFYYGFNLGLEFKGIDLALFFQGLGDVQRVNDERRAGESMNSENINSWASVRARWSAGNPSTTLPRAAIGDPASNTRFSDRWIEDAGFLRLRNLQLGYTLPASLLAKSKWVSSCRISLTGNNVLTWTNYTGLDPEVDNIPPTRAWILGLNFSF